MMLPLLSGFDGLYAGAAAGDDYKAELAERQAEYAKKFDMTTLKWSGATSANGNINYGTTARNYLYWQGGSFGGVQYRNYIHVFAFEGDTICFGSDVYNSTLNADGTAKATAAQQEEYRTKLGAADATVDIVLTDLSGNRILYDVRPNGTGHIANVQQEVLAKTMESPDGHEETTSAGTYSYVPLQYEVRETGVYTLEFHSYDYNNNDGQTTKNDTVDPSGSKKNVADNFYAPVKYTESSTTVYHEPTDAQHGALVAAWDVSVFNEQGHKETGRVYADYLSMQQNGGYDVRETYYVLTTDSYIYRWEWKGLRPNTYNFFADNHGLTDAATNSTLYKSVKELKNANFDYKKFGASFKYPGSVNTDLSKSYYIFFEMPNADLEGHLYTRALQPDPAENIQFVDHIEKDGKEIPGAYKGRGGYFSFETKEATTATLVLDFEQLTDADGTPVVKGDGSGHTYAPVTISGPVTPYSINYFYWDGKDGNGEVIPAGDYNISDILTLTTKAGEIHFPVHDVESATGGFTFTRVSPIYDRDGDGSVAISPTEGKMGERYTAFLPTVTFDSPGTYKFTVTETGGKGLGSGGMDPKLGHTEITVVATSNEGKLSLAVSADPDKYDSGGAGSFFENNSGNVTLNFINSYNESGAFPLSLTKELTGRLWTTERFTFTIEPDDVAKAAIADGTLTLPADWHADGDGKYTFTIDNTASSETTAEGWTKRTLSLGELHVGNVGAKKMQYQFTIREDTSSFDAEDLACIQPDILLTVTTNSYNTESHLEGKVSFGATYAYLTDGVRGDDIELDGTEVIVPFVNNDTRIGSITVEKTIQNDTPSLTDSFNFQIRLTNSEGMVLSSEALKATDGGGSPVEIEWRTEDGGTLVGSFALCHEQKLVLENVPYGTDYTVTEEKTNGYHLQEVLDKTGAQIAAGTGGDGFDARHRAVSGTLDHDHSEIYLHFVNGRAFYVPFTGGLGWLLWTVLGIALLTVPPCIYYCIRRRRQRSM